MQHLNLEEFANGSFTAQVNQAIKEVMENIQNPNTDARAVRKVTVTVAFKSNEQRNFVTTGVVAKSSLVPALGVVTAISVGKNLETGEVEAVEISNQLPGQLSMDVIEQQGYDQSTGEIYETVQHDNKVVDLRSKKA